jgi:ribonuclease E
MARACRERFNTDYALAVGAFSSGDPTAARGEPRGEPRGGEERGGQRSRRRGRRGGRRGRERRAGEPRGGSEQPDVGFTPEGVDEAAPRKAPAAVRNGAGAPHNEGRPARRERARAPAPAHASEDVYDAAGAEVMAEPVAKAPAAEPEAAAPKRPRHRAGASEPRIERIVVGGEAGTDSTGDVATEGSAAPARKGWWQRRLSGE